jgi:hypothetical protein
MAKKPKKKKKDTTTEDFVDILDIRESIVILKSGSLRSVIEVGSMNFNLKSTDEQQAIVVGFQDFLNSVDFPLQITINSRKLNIDNYITNVTKSLENVPNELLKIHAEEYVRFIKGLADLANIMTKKFYVVVPFFIVETKGQNTEGGFMDKLKTIFKPGDAVKSISDDDLSRYKIQLDQRLSVVMSGISRLGISTRVLEYDELVKLYYSYYNPGATT